MIVSLVLPLVSWDNSFNYYIRVDYIYWLLIATVIYSSVASLIEGKGLVKFLFYTGASFILLARLVSAIMSLTVNPDMLFVGGLVSSREALVYSYPLNVFGAIFVLSALVLEQTSLRDHKVLGQNTVFKIKKCIVNFFDKNFAVFLIGFLFGFLIRLLPEIYFWPRPIGFDTIMYIAHLRDFVLKPSLFGTYTWGSSLRNTPPLIDWILYFPGKIIDPWFLYKIYPPVAFGLLIGLIGIYSRIVLRYNLFKVYAIVFVSGLNLLLLRLSWDLHKQMLATILTIAALILLDSNKYISIRKHVIIVIFLLLSSLASEFGVMFTLILASVAIYIILQENASFLHRIGKTMIYILTMFFSLALYSHYMHRIIVSNPVIGVSFPTTSMLHENPGGVMHYIVVGIGILLPLFYASLKYVIKNAKHSVMFSIVLIILVFLTWLAPYTDFTAQQYDRVMMSLVTVLLPLSMYSINYRNNQVFKNMVAALIVLLLVMPGIYATIHPSLEDYNIPLIATMKRMPPYLVPAPEDPYYFDKLNDAAQKLANIYSKGKVIITSIYFIRFVQLYIRFPDHHRYVSSGWKYDVGSIVETAIRVNTTDFYTLLPQKPINLIKSSIKSYLSTINHTMKIAQYIILIEKIDVNEVYSNNVFGIYHFRIITKIHK